MNAVCQQPKDKVSASGYLTIDLDALRGNYLTLKQRVGEAKLAAVVKADAYGLGAMQVAPEFYKAGCRIFFVAMFDEAIALRSIIPHDAELYVLNGLQPGQEAKSAELNIRPVLNSLPQIQNWARQAHQDGNQLKAAIQIDSGMSRLGLSAEELAALQTDDNLLNNISIEFVMSHLACADEPDHEQNRHQLEAFQAAIAVFGSAPHCFANSGGIFLGESFHHQIIRPGVSLYGVSPTRDKYAGLKPVVTLDVSVIQTRTVKTGTAIGYGAGYIASKEMRLATIAAGYADGLPRSLSDRGAAFFNGKRLPFVGRVSMDSIILDISCLGEDELTLGDRVEIIGPNQPLDQLADAAGTIAYEILTSLGNRYRREYLHTSKSAGSSQSEAFKLHNTVKAASASL